MLVIDDHNASSEKTGGRESNAEEREWLRFSWSDDVRSCGCWDGDVDDADCVDDSDGDNLNVSVMPGVRTVTGF